MWEERFQPTYGVLRDEVLKTFDEYLSCGLLQHGAAVLECCLAPVPRTDSTGRTRREEYVSRLDPETVRRVHSTGRWFLLHVKEEPGDSVTPLGGVPTAVEGLFPLRKAVVDEMSAGTWPKAPPEDDEPGDEPDAPKRKGPPRKPKSPGTGRTDEDLKDAFAAAAG